MVLLTITGTLLEALEKRANLRQSTKSQDDTRQEHGAASDDVEEKGEEPVKSSEPSLETPTLGAPISHGQIIDLWMALIPLEDPNYSLEKLLHKSQVYTPPPPPKPEPSEEYKKLMARLRREEEARAYERMINPPLPMESFSSRFPNAFAAVNAPISAADLGDDDVTYDEVHRQVTLIINFMVSIAGVAGTLWVVSRWWSVTARLFLVLGGSILVAVAEVAVYSAYMWRMGEGKRKEGQVKEVKEVMQTWVVGENGEHKDGEEDDMVLLKSKDKDKDSALRKRNTAANSEGK